jgi:hypothetical protein
LVLALLLITALPVLTQPAAAHQSGRVTARLGISAGVAIEDAPLGLDGRALRERIPVLFTTADRLDVRIETVSVGQGFFADDGMLLSEKDLDLVVTGRRTSIATLAATLGKAFDQSLVFVWFFERDGGQATAAILLPGGAEALTTAIYQQLVTELADGGHVRYAGRRDLIFVANTGDEPEPAFFARMERVRVLLGRAGIPTGPVRCDRADFLVIDRASYDDYIGDSASPRPATVTTSSGRSGHPHRACA